MAMNLMTTQCPPPLVLDLGRALPAGRRQRRVAVNREMIGLYGSCLAWSHRWGWPLHLQAVSNWELALVGRGGIPVLGSENRSPKRNWCCQNSGRDADQYGRDEMPMDSFENRISFEGSESFSGGWESEQDLSEAGFAESDHSSQGDSNGNPTESLRGEHGSSDTEIMYDSRADSWERERNSINENNSSIPSSSSTPGSPAVGPKEPVYEVIEVGHSGKQLKKLVSRRQLLRTSGLRLRDLRRVDPSLWVTNSAPALLVRDEAILLNLGSLRAIATTQEVLIFDQNRYVFCFSDSSHMKLLKVHAQEKLQKMKNVGAQAFMGTLIPRLQDHNTLQNTSTLPFGLEVIESALMSRTQRVERSLMDVEPRVLRLLEVLPTCMTADVLEDLRVSKQELVEVGAKAGALRQMLLELLEHPHDIRRMVIMGRICTVKGNGSVDCLVPEDKLVVEDEEEEMEMLLEYYLQRCESCHGQALKLLSSAKEMEDSIGVNLSSRRLEVSRLELLLQVATFCAALGALVAGIFGMNLKSYLEDRALAFFFTTGGIVFGGIALFIYMFSYLSSRKIL